MIPLAKYNFANLVIATIWGFGSLLNQEDLSCFEKDLHSIEWKVELNEQKFPMIEVVSLPPMGHLFTHFFDAVLIKWRPWSFSIIVNNLSTAIQTKTYDEYM